MAENLYGLLSQLGALAPSKQTMGEWLTAPARAMSAQPPTPTDGLGILGQIHEAIDPVRAMGGYGNMLAMALPPGAKPQRLYHGTNQVFDRFGPGHVYMVDDAAIASRYADPSRFSVRERARPNVIPLEANFKNPLVIDMKGKSGHWKEQIAGGDIFDLAKKGGHDGIILKDMHDIFSDKPQTQYIAISPGTVKSAITKDEMF